MADERGQDLYALVGSQELRGAWEPVRSRPLDEAVWQAWMAKGRAQDSRSHARRMKAVRWVTAATLLAAVGLWSHLTPYEVQVRFIVALGATVVMFQAFHARRYAFAAAFGALALLYNPVAPIVTFSGDWQRALVGTSAVPFVTLLAWRDVRPAHND